MEKKLASKKKNKKYQNQIKIFDSIKAFFPLFMLCCFDIGIRNRSAQLRTQIKYGLPGSTFHIVGSTLKGTLGSRCNCTVKILTFEAQLRPLQTLIEGTVRPVCHHTTNILTNLRPSSRNTIWICKIESISIVKVTSNISQFIFAQKLSY